MDVYVLDDLLRRTEVVDDYESLIWTERFRDIGDFQLDLDSSYKNRMKIRKGARLAIQESSRIMVVKEIVDSTDDEGKSLLTITGRSLEEITEDRVARHNFEDLNSNPRWALKGKPASLIRSIFKSICIDGTLHSKDVIPLVEINSFLPNGTIPEPDEEIRIELEPMTLYDAIRSLCVEYDLGFRLVSTLDSTKLYFDVYTGSDRTTRQSRNSAVIFSPELDSLTNVARIDSISEYKNVAYVFSPSLSTVIYPLGVDPNNAGFERRVLLVKVDNVTPNNGEEKLSTLDILRRRGREALAEHRQVTVFDGEIPKTGYQYEVDYYLGDIVEMRKSDDITNYMRVTEQIFVSDAEGARAYPTLANEAI